MGGGDVVAKQPVGFSARQVDILHLIAEGKSDEEIARVLSISPHTVRGHLKRLYRQHGVHTRASAIAAFLATKPFSNSEY
jgi:DNA-binding CsgD family transcriptional regulator